MSHNLVWVLDIIQIITHGTLLDFVAFTLCIYSLVFTHSLKRTPVQISQALLGVTPFLVVLHAADSVSFLLVKLWTLFTPTQDTYTLLGLPPLVLHSRKCFHTDIRSHLGNYFFHFPLLRDRGPTLTFVQCVTIVLLYILSNFLTVYRTAVVSVTLLCLEAMYLFFKVLRSHES